MRQDSRPSFETPLPRAPQDEVIDRLGKNCVQGFIGQARDYLERRFKYTIKTKHLPELRGVGESSEDRKFSPAGPLTTQRG
jgi:hypothetical protein